MPTTELLQQAAATARRRLASLVAAAGEMTESREMYARMVSAEVRINAAAAPLADPLSAVFDDLIILAHDALLVGTTEASKRAVRLLDLRLDMTHEHDAYMRFHTDRVTDQVMAAAAMRTSTDHAILATVTATAVVDRDPAVLLHAFRNAPDLAAVAIAIMRANPQICAAELLAATRATALPHQGSATPSSS